MLHSKAKKAVMVYFFTKDLKQDVHELVRGETQQDSSSEVSISGQ
jgi:hypothetical protein